MEKYCLCEGCRFSKSHTTAYHRCGKCGSYGHGRIECYSNNNGNYSKQNLLFEIRNKYPKTLPKENWCQIKDCKIRQTHNTNSHQLLFSKDEHATYDGPDQYGITSTYETNKKNGVQLLKNYNNSYVKSYWGMGNYIFTRNINGKIEQKVIDCSNHKKINEFTYGLNEISDKSSSYYLS